MPWHQSKNNLEPPLIGRIDQQAIESIGRRNNKAPLSIFSLSYVLLHL